MQSDKGKHTVLLCFILIEQLIGKMSSSLQEGCIRFHDGNVATLGNVRVTQGFKGLKRMKTKKRTPLQKGIKKSTWMHQREDPKTFCSKQHG